MKPALFASLPAFVCLAIFPSLANAAESPASPPPTQLPRSMHVPMTTRPHVRVGIEDGDLRGNDQRALQAAVDYVAGLGGGTVEIGPGTYRMRDSLHLRTGVTVQGTEGKTILRKADGAVSALELDGDFGEEQITLKNPAGFEVGDGVAIWDKNAGGFHTTVARITGRRGNVFSLSLPLNADCMVENRAQAATVFPVVSGYDAEGVVVRGLVIEGNKENNVALNGCRGAGIFLYRCHGAVIERCAVREYPGDGISFQQCNDVTVADCVVESNAGLGLHPGSGSQRPRVLRNQAVRNGEDGLFLCWRVQQGLFEGNVLENNGRFGISIGHKDTDNLLRGNTVRGNASDGVFFRNETLGMAAHRNRLENNLIENNGVEQDAAGIRVRGETRDLILLQNTIRDTRTGNDRRQSTGVALEERAGKVTMEGNTIEAPTPIQDARN